MQFNLHGIKRIAYNRIVFDDRTSEDFSIYEPLNADEMLNINHVCRMRLVATLQTTNEWIRPRLGGNSAIVNYFEFIYLYLNNKNRGIEMLSHIKRMIEIDVRVIDWMTSDDGRPKAIVNFLLLSFKWYAVRLINNNR